MSGAVSRLLVAGSTDELPDLSDTNAVDIDRNLDSPQVFLKGLHLEQYSFGLPLLSFGSIGKDWPHIPHLCGSASS